MNSETSFNSASEVDDAETMSEVHGSFFGVTHSAARLEGLIAAHVPRKHFEDVSDLVPVKWFDYRRMAPGHCFMLFADAYHSSFRIAARKMLAYKRREKHKVGLFGLSQVQWTPETLWERDRTFISSLWNAMMMIDSLGLPYQDYMRLAMLYAEECKWERLPRPNQLYSDKVAIGVMKYWEANLAQKNILAKHPRYLSERHQDYIDFLLGQLKARTNKVQPAAAMVLKGHLQRDDLIGVLGDYEMKRLDLQIA